MKYKLILLIYIAFISICIAETESYRHELYIITVNGSGEDIWYHEIQSIVYESRDYESIPRYCITHEYDSGTLIVPGNQDNNKYGYDWDGVTDPQGVYEFIGHGFYKIQVGNSEDAPYFYFDFRDADLSVPGTSTPDIWIYYNYDYQNKFVLYRNSDSTNYHEVVYSGEAVSFWDVHNKTCAYQEPFEATDDFVLKIFWNHDGRPYLIWNQTTPQGTRYEVYRKIGRFGLWVKISGPEPFLYYIDREFSKGGTDIAYYYVKTIDNKMSNLVSTRGEYIPAAKGQIFDIKSLDPAKADLFFGPNPFNNDISIRINSPASAVNEIAIYDMLGKCVYVQQLPERTADYAFCWDAKDLSGRPLRSGVYFLIVTSGGKTLLREKLVYLK
ncbi:MAG: hypothetical protein DRP96_05860 [Candidatus Neomarinimicrobiota bacterium]|nr:MAG: hypothetical protein DRP96_05860 [Candidatus Neomarinimicrobiota bacterium]